MHIYNIHICIYNIYIHKYIIYVYIYLHIYIYIFPYEHSKPSMFWSFSGVLWVLYTNFDRNKFFP